MTEHRNTASPRRFALDSILCGSWRLLPLVYLSLGGVILIAQAAVGHLRGGLFWFAVMAAVAAVYGFGGRFQLIRQARGDFEDERDAAINLRAMAATGAVLVAALLICIVVELARGNDPGPYSMLMAIGSLVYAGVLISNRLRS